MVSRYVINLSCAVLLAAAIPALGQTHVEPSSNQSKVNVAEFDFAPLWTTTNSRPVFGFIGEHYQRIRIRVMSATREPDHPDRYAISGKSMVKNNICNFAGTIRISGIHHFAQMHFGVDDTYKDSGIVKQGIVQGAYEFFEDSSQTHVGVFQGSVTTAWYVDRRGHLRYDDIQIDSDSYSNNQFIGTWTAYNAGKPQVCNWGDYRAPESGDLDIGTGEFYPDEKYLKSGWQSWRDAYYHENKSAKEEEDRAWWK